MKGLQIIGLESLQQQLLHYFSLCLIYEILRTKSLFQSIWLAVCKNQILLASYKKGQNAGNRDFVDNAFEKHLFENDLFENDL